MLLSLPPDGDSCVNYCSHVTALETESGGLARRLMATAVSPIVLMSPALETESGGLARRLMATAVSPIVLMSPLLETEKFIRGGCCCGKIPPREVQTNRHALRCHNGEHDGAGWMPPGALSVENCGGVVWRGAVFSFFVRSAPTAVYFQVKYSKSKFRRTNAQLFLLTQAHILRCNLV